MAHVLYYPDGTRDVLTGQSREDFHDALHDIIETRLGCEAAELFNEVTIEGHGCNQPEGENWEEISDGYYQALSSAMEELDAILKQFESPRLNRQKLETSLWNLRRSINSII